MSGLVLEDLSKNFGSITAVDKVNLCVSNGQFICLLGPSGCGKTTLLRLIAGLETPTSGRVLLDDKDITQVPANQRNFGMVFQSLALFSHLTVGENIAYSLRIRKVDRTTQHQRTEELLELIELPGIADRHISQLSGGQRQRVAIARALAFEPKLFLLDEPLSALDAKLRETMQVELRQLQQRLGITTILVTHDQREAMTMADQIVVLGQQNVQQIGTPLEIYHKPVNAFVANFIGTSNLLTATVAGKDEVLLVDRRFKIKEMTEAFPEGTEIKLSIRPEDVQISGSDQMTASNQLPGTVSFIRDVGASVETHIDCDGLTLISASMPHNRPDVKEGDQITVELPVSACVGLRHNGH